MTVDCTSQLIIAGFLIIGGDYTDDGIGYICCGVGE